MEGNASVHQGNPVSRKPVREGRRFQERGSLILIKREAVGGKGGGGTGGAAQIGRGNYKSFLYYVGFLVEDPIRGATNYHYENLQNLRVAKEIRSGS